ncbi:hypothetical protein JI721_09240 [Alicyclobacillus cycloheptanicus]|jgi:hypothetical protein|uniref:Uncharacterized protein n=1 Tax=Alicyclobacillus cycloheptanicus TaxID=1457 RepID=A0ABT9XH78_9BACL|nr:hypothetical protein [Alicyclobacillus cycloheptanicus]MDQ0189657.1 hypothetical protein [Alicyclobacillus cycloheptanicus]WDL99957.1 hypothetical protein JI721_09240 [Alicyclobacillus cycloheptanicus]
MPAVVSIGFIHVGGTSNCAGIFSGQNMQNDWDANSPAMSVLGTTLGNGNLKSAYLAQLRNEALLGQPTYDQDIKCNGSPTWIGP